MTTLGSDLERVTAPMATDFIVERGDLHFHASYAEPLFALWKDSDMLFQRLFSSLSKHGLQLTDLKWNQPASVGDVQLSFYLFNFAVGVRLRIDRIEVEAFEVRKVDQEQLERAVIDLIGALRSHKPELSFTAYSLAIGYHGKLATGSARDFTRTLTAAPQDLGKQTGAGAVFYYWPEEDRVSSAVTADLSAVIADALFFRTLVVWDPSRVAVNELRAQMTGYMERVFDRFGLSVTATPV